MAVKRLRRGLCLVLVAPSGAGKTSVSRALLEQEEALSLSISATTRAPRPGEVEGVHYHFRTPEQFEAMERAGEMLESATVYGRRYGTPRAPVLEALAAGRDVLFDVDWQGHKLIRAALPDDVVGVFLLPPSLPELERRLRGRGQDSDAEIARRMEAALKGAGVPVESLYYSTEGHGFYKKEHQREYYTRLLAFLAKNLGGKVASTPAAVDSKGKAP